jgi:hypothetical protein
MEPNSDINKININPSWSNMMNELVEQCQAIEDLETVLEIEKKRKKLVKRKVDFSQKCEKLVNKRDD